MIGCIKRSTTSFGSPSEIPTARRMPGFAILGLRALYFALAAMIHRFKYLKYALALVLVFIGTKIFLVGIIGKMPPVISLSVTFGLIVGGVIVSLWKTRGEPAALVKP